MRILILLFLLSILPNCGGEDPVLETIRQHERQRRALELQRMRQGIDMVISETSNVGEDCWDCIEFEDAK